MYLNRGFALKPWTQKTKKIRRGDCVISKCGTTWNGGVFEPILLANNNVQCALLQRRWSLSAVFLNIASSLKTYDGTRKDGLSNFDNVCSNWEYQLFVYTRAKH